MTESMSNTPPSYTGRMVCYNHTDRETMLRCNRCDRPMCTACAVLTPTGYRCKNCVRGQQKVFETSLWQDYPLAMVVAGLLSFFGSVIASYMGFFTVFVAPVAGVLIAEAVRWVVRRRRSRLLFQLAVVGAVIGAIPLVITTALWVFGVGISAFTDPTWQAVYAGSMLDIVWQGLYVFLVASTIYYRLSGIQVR